MNALEPPDLGMGSDRPRVRVPGYAVVLLRTYVKDALRHFRNTCGFVAEQSIERCLVTAGVDLLLNQPDLHGRWIAALTEAARRDAELLTQQWPSAALPIRCA